MVKPLLGVVLLSIATMMSPTSPSTGCQRAFKAHTDLAYPKNRDMRTSIALLSQRGWYRAPDSASVPVTGREVLGDPVTFDASWVNSTPRDAESIARGAAGYARVCTPCHGTALDGNGPVWQSKKFLVPIPNLMQPSTRARTDGFMYRYIRFGGAVMPSYDAQVSAEEARDIVNYVRDHQEKTPQ
jgi:S-disulfanyl-L-cysteine oxidoreductase SoxD